MTEYDDESNIKQDTKICIYFRKGNCLKSNRCLFKHTPLPVFNRGQKCIFLAQNRCRFSHSELINNMCFQPPTEGFSVCTEDKQTSTSNPNMSVWMEYQIAIKVKQKQKTRRGKKKHKKSELFCIMSTKAAELKGKLKSLKSETSNAAVFIVQDSHGWLPNSHFFLLNFAPFFG